MNVLQIISWSISDSWT